MVNLNADRFLFTARNPEVRGSCFQQWIMESQISKYIAAYERDGYTVRVQELGERGEIKLTYVTKS